MNGHPQIFFCGYRALQLLGHNAEREREIANDIKCSQK